MQIGDIVWYSNFGMGRIVDIDFSLAPYLVYFYKGNSCLHNGDGRGPDYHYWWCFESSLTLVSSVPLCKLIERRRNENR